jgi:hypothetical protein
LGTGGVLVQALDIFRTGATGQDVIGHIQNVIVFVIGQMKSQQLDSAIDGFIQTQTVEHGVNGFYRAESKGSLPPTHFVPQVDRLEQRCCFICVLPLRYTLLIFLASGEGFVVYFIHSKCPLSRVFFLKPNSLYRYWTGISSLSLL